MRVRLPTFSGLSLSLFIALFVHNVYLLYFYISFDIVIVFVRNLTEIEFLSSVLL